MSAVRRAGRIRWADLRPRRASGLPPGQRLLGVYPRFADNPLKPPPVIEGSSLLIRGASDVDDFSLDVDDLAAIGNIERDADFHCVTTWSVRSLRWGGVAMADVWRTLIEPRIGDGRTATFVRAVGADRYNVAFTLEDLLEPDVILAWTLNGEPLDARHGAPLRLVSPSQYGYKSVKHLSTLELLHDQPRIGSKEHLRARVHLEERHSRLPARLVRVPYRSVIRITALLAERSARGTTP